MCLNRDVPRAANRRSRQLQTAGPEVSRAKGAWRLVAVGCAVSACPLYKMIGFTDLVRLRTLGLN